MGGININRNADDLIAEFMAIGIDQDKAAKAALITVNRVKDVCSPFAESSLQKTKNYLLKLIYGEEKAKNIHDLEQELRSLRNKMIYAEPGNCLSEREDEIKKELKRLL